MQHDICIKFIYVRNEGNNTFSFHALSRGLKGGFQHFSLPSLGLVILEDSRLVGWSLYLITAARLSSRADLCNFILI